MAKCEKWTILYLAIVFARSTILLSMKLILTEGGAVVACVSRQLVELCAKNKSHVLAGFGWAGKIHRASQL